MRHFLFFVLLFSFTNSFGQFGTKGQKLFGATLSFNTGKITNNTSPDTKPYGFNIGGSFTLGTFTKDNVLKSGTVSYSHSYSRDELQNNVGLYYSNSVYLAYGLTKYKKIAKDLFFGIGGNAFSIYNFSNSKFTTSPQTGETKTFSIGVSIFPTLSYQLTNRFVVNLSANNQFLNLAYGIGTSKTFSPIQAAKGTSQSFNLDAGLFGADLKNLTFGFSYLLKNKAGKK